MCHVTGEIVGFREPLLLPVLFTTHFLRISLPLRLLCFPACLVFWPLFPPVLVTAHFLRILLPLCLLCFHCLPRFLFCLVTVPLHTDTYPNVKLTKPRGLKTTNYPLKLISSSSLHSQLTSPTLHPSRTPAKSHALPPFQSHRIALACPYACAGNTVLVCMFITVGPMKKL